MKYKLSQKLLTENVNLEGERFGIRRKEKGAVRGKGMRWETWSLVEILVERRKREKPDLIMLSWGSLSSEQKEKWRDTDGSFSRIEKARERGDPIIFPPQLSFNFSKVLLSDPSQVGGWLFESRKTERRTPLKSHKKRHLDSPFLSLAPTFWINWQSETKALIHESNQIYIETKW